MKLLMATVGMAMSSMVAHAQGPLTQLDNQDYALCAGAISFVFDQVAYANCQILFGTSISLTLSYPPVSLTGQPGGNIETVNQLGMTQGNFIVSTYSTPASLTSPQGNTAVYTCPAGSTAAFASETRRKRPSLVLDRSQANKLFALVQLQLLAPLSNNNNSNNNNNNNSSSNSNSSSLPLGIKYLAHFPAFKARIALIYVMLLCKMDQLYILVLRLERLKLCQGF
jgi:hypothetical protein